MMSYKLSVTARRRLRRSILFCLVLLAPIIVLWLSGLAWIRMHETKLRELLNERLDAQGQTMIARSTPIYQLTEYFRQLYQALETEKFRSRNLPAHFPQCPEALDLEIVAFNRDGALWKPIETELENPDLLQRFWYAQHREDDSATDETSEFNDLLGFSWHRNELLEQQGIALPTLKNGQPGYFIWQSGSDKEGLIIRTRDRPDAFLGLKALLTHRPYECTWVLYDMQGSRYQVIGSTLQEWQSIVRESIFRQRQFFSTDAYNCCLLQHPAGFWVFAATPGVTGHLQTWRWVLMGCCSAALLFTLILWLYSTWTPLENTSLTTRIAIFSIVSGLIPIALLLTFGSQTWTEAYQVAVTDFHRSNLDRLDEAERRIDEFLVNRQTELQRLVRQPIFQESDASEFAQVTESWSQLYGVTHVQLYDASGKLVIRSRADHPTAPLMDLIALTATHQQSQPNFSRPSAQAQPSVSLQQSGLLSATEAAETLEAPKTSETPEASEASEAPEALEAPKVPETSEALEALKTTEATETTGLPSATGTSVVDADQRTNPASDHQANELAVPVPVAQNSEALPSFLIKPELGFVKIMDSPGRLILEHNTQQENLLFWDIITTATGDRRIVTFSLSARRLREKFLEEQLPRSVYAFSGQLQRWFPSFPAAPGIQDLAFKTLLGNQPQKLIGGVGKEARIFSSLPSVSFPNVVFLTSADLHESVQQTERNHRIGAGFLFGFILALALLVRRFSVSLTSPVATLQHGIEALERRELGFRLSELGDDEFGVLADSFNRLMRERQDLNLAAQMQERLLPNRLPTIPGYSCAFRWNSLSQLAGDYCDIQLHPDGSVVFLVVDVAGHGLGAGLISMMMKAVVERSVRLGKPLEQIIAALHGLIFTTTKKAFLATMVTAQLFPDRHLLRWCKAGHPSPYLRYRDGRVEKMAMRSFPLGIRRAPQYTVQELTMEQLSTFFMFTDGIIEAVNPAGDPFGLERLESFLHHHGHHYTTMLDALLQLCEAHRDTAPAEDDVTLLQVTRLDTTEEQHKI